MSVQKILHLIQYLNSVWSPKRHQDRKSQARIWGREGPRVLGPMIPNGVQHIYFPEAKWGYHVFKKNYSNALCNFLYVKNFKGRKSISTIGGEGGKLAQVPIGVYRVFLDPYHYQEKTYKISDVTWHFVTSVFNDFTCLLPIRIRHFFFFV
jgi:hypothetical protein